jgi:translocator protein
MQTNRPMLPANASRSLIYLALAVFIVIATALIGSTTTRPQIMDWYATINKPWFNPPNWVFPVVWPLLFALMAFSFWRVLRHEEEAEKRNRAALAFFFQIICNIGWSMAFFGANSPKAGLVVAGFLVLTVAWMVVTFRRVDNIAGLVQLPYLAWVTFAMVLNATIVMIN